MDKVFLRNLAYDSIPEKVLKMRTIKEIVIEPSSFCNLRCMSCSNQWMKRDKGLMRLSDFKTIVDKLPSSVKNIRMNWSGEPILNKDIFKMVKYATGKGIKTHISTNVTILNTFSDKDIIDSGLDSIAICIDGTTKNVHESYRVGSNFDEIVKNAVQFGKIIKNNKLKTKIILQTLLIKGNTDIDEIKKLGRKIYADEIHLRYFTVGSETIEMRNSNYDKFVPDNEKMTIYIKDSIDSKTTGKCNAFFTPVVCWNGDVTICCFDFEAEYKYGNIISDSFEDIVKKMPLKSIFNRKFPKCKGCDVNESTSINYKVIIL